MAIPTIQGLAGITAEPDLRYTHSNKAVLNIRFAFNDRRFNEQTNRWEDTKTFYVDGTAWEDTATRLADQLRMGDQVYVEGRLETQQWEQDGQKRSKPHLIVRTVKPFQKAPQQAQQQGGYQQQSQADWGAAPATAWGGGQQQQGGPSPF